MSDEHPFAHSTPRPQSLASSLMMKSTGLVVAVLVGSGVWHLGTDSTVIEADDHSASGASAATTGATTGGPFDALHATSSASTADFDGDGLSDDQERVLGTFPFSADTDGDGYPDGEEFARQSDPRDESSMPDSSQVSASLTARGQDGKLRLVLAVHEPDGFQYDSFVRLGALSQGQAISVPMGRVIDLSTVFEATGSDGSRVTVLEIPVHSGLIHARERVTFFIAAGASSTMAFGAASKIDVISTDGVLQLQRVASAQASLHSSQGGGSIRQPIPSTATPTIPSSWTAGAICFQRSSVVGGMGAVMLHEVVDADCLAGWDTYCSSDCSTSIGTTYETIDPVALIGG